MDYPPTVTYPDGDVDTSHEGSYDARCASCWLNHGHNVAQHWDNIARHEVWGNRPGPHIPFEDPSVKPAMYSWLMAEIAGAHFREDCPDCRQTTTHERYQDGSRRCDRCHRHSLPPTIPPCLADLEFCAVAVPATWADVFTPTGQLTAFDGTVYQQHALAL